MSITRVPAGSVGDPSPTTTPGPLVALDQTGRDLRDPAASHRVVERVDGRRRHLDDDLTGRGIGFGDIDESQDVVVAVLVEPDRSHPGLLVPRRASRDVTRAGSTCSHSEQMGDRCTGSMMRCGVNRMRATRSHRG